MKVEYVTYSLNELNRVMDILTNLMDDNQALDIVVAAREDKRNRICVGVYQLNPDKITEIEGLIGQDSTCWYLKMSQAGIYKER